MKKIMLWPQSHLWNDWSYSHRILYTCRLY